MWTVLHDPTPCAADGRPWGDDAAWRRFRHAATLGPMSRDRADHRSDRAARRRRPFVVGFLIGFFVTVPATFLALLFNWAERASDFIVPSTFLLRPLAPYMANWHGALNMGLASLVNGLVYGLIAAAIAALVWLTRAR